MSAIETLSTQLVQQAPDLSSSTIEELRIALWAVGSPLALAIARIYELVEMDVVDPGIALPALAMACATLAGGMRGSLDNAALEAARFEIETLLPVPNKPPKPAAPDVPLTSLGRRPRT